jgi:hypothetical protein
MLGKDQYEKIGRIIVHECLTNRKVNRALSQSKYYGALLSIIQEEPKKVKKLTLWHTIKTKYLNRLRKS